MKDKKLIELENNMKSFIAWMRSPASKIKNLSWYKGSTIYDNEEVERMLVEIEKLIEGGE